MKNNLKTKQQMPNLTKTNSRLCRAAHLQKQLRRMQSELKRTKEERAAAISFILTLRKWDEFEQFINLTACCDYERLEREIIDNSRAMYQAQLGLIMNRR